MTTRQIQNELYTSLCDDLARLRGLLKQERQKKQLIQYRASLIGLIKREATMQELDQWEFEEMVLANEEQLCLHEIGYLKEELQKCLRLLEQMHKSTFLDKNPSMLLQSSNQSHLIH